MLRVLERAAESLDRLGVPAEPQQGRAEGQPGGDDVLATGVALRPRECGGRRGGRLIEPPPGELDLRLRLV